MAQVLSELDILARIGNECVGHISCPLSLKL